MLHDKTEPKCELREGLKSHRSSNSWQVGKFVLGVRIRPANPVTVIQTTWLQTGDYFHFPAQFLAHNGFGNQAAL